MLGVKPEGVRDADGEKDQHQEVRHGHRLNKKSVQTNLFRPQSIVILDYKNCSILLAQII